MKKNITNTELIRILKHQVKNNNDREKLLITIGLVIGSHKFTYKQLWQIRDIIKKSKLKDMYLFMNEILLDLHQYGIDTAVDNYTEYYHIYQQ